MGWLGPPSNGCDTVCDGNPITEEDNLLMQSSIGCCGLGHHCVCDSGVELTLESEPQGHAVGKVTRAPSNLHIEFPEDATASDKAGILAAALLVDMRLR